MANTKVSLENGKYVFEIDEKTGQVSCDRFDRKKWVVFEAGSNALISLVHRAHDLLEELSTLKMNLPTLSRRVVYALAAHLGNVPVRGDDVETVKCVENVVRDMMKKHVDPKERWQDSDDERARCALALLGWEFEAFEAHLDVCSPRAMRKILELLGQESSNENAELLSRTAAKMVRRRLENIGEKISV